MRSNGHNDEHMPKRMRTPNVKGPAMLCKITFWEVRRVEVEANHIVRARLKCGDCYDNGT